MQLFVFTVLIFTVPGPELVGMLVASICREALLLKQIIKRRPRTTRPQTRRRRSFLLPRHPNLIQLTRIPFILLCDPLLHWLHTLKPAARIEIRTLLARMQLKRALRTLAVARSRLQQSPALRAPRHRPRARQIERFRPERVVPLRRTALAFHRRFPRLLVPRITPRLTPRFPIAILIPMLPVFSHKPSQARAYCLPRPPRPASPV
jgi:hypothetical protein